MIKMKFSDKLASVQSEPLKALDIKILQVNLGYQLQYGMQTLPRVSGACANRGHDK